MKKKEIDTLNWAAELFCSSDLFVGLSFVYWSLDQLAEDRRVNAYDDETEDIVSDLEKNPRTVIGQWRVKVDDEGRFVRDDEFIDYDFSHALRDQLKDFLAEHPDDKERIVEGTINFLKECIEQVKSL